MKSNKGLGNGKGKGQMKNVKDSSSSGGGRDWVAVEKGITTHDFLESQNKTSTFFQAS